MLSAVFRDLAGVIPAGHQITGVPAAIFDVWRVLLWAMMMLLVGEWAGRLLRERHDRGSVFLGQAALLVFTARSALLQAERWHDGAVWEGLPVTTLAVLLAYLAVHRRHHDERDARAIRDRR